MDLTYLRQKLVFKKKKDLKPRSDGKPHYRLEDVVSGLPSSKHYGVFTAWFINTFCPEKNYLDNMKYLFDDNEAQTIFQIQNNFTKSYKTINFKTPSGKIESVEVPGVVEYKPEDMIEMFACHKEVITEVYKRLSKLIHKELSYKKDLTQQDRALAFILSRMDALDFDVAATPFAENFFETEFGFKYSAFMDIINVLVSQHYFYRTHGTGVLKRRGVITLPDGIQTPRTYDEANYIPSLLVPDYKILGLLNKIKSKFTKKTKKKNLKGLYVKIMGNKVKIPVPFVDDINQLDSSVVKAFPRTKFGNSDTYCVLRRTRQEFIRNLSNFGFKNKTYPFMECKDLSNTDKEQMCKLYDFIARMAFKFDFCYSKVIRVVTKYFQEIGCNLYYRKGSFKYVVQYVLYGQTDSEFINKIVG